MADFSDRAFRPGIDVHAGGGRPHRAVRVILGHLSPVRLRLTLSDSPDRSWTGAKIWPSGLALADWLSRQHAVDLVSNARVLELGCGSAPLPSVAAALSGASEVVATDGHEAAVQLASASLQQYREHIPDIVGRLNVHRLDWDAPQTMSRGGFDVILFADGVYTEAAAIALASCIEYCLRDQPRACVYGVIPETRIGAADFCREMRLRGFSATALDLGPSADAPTFMIEAFENCAKENVLESGACRLVQWRRGPLPGIRDESRLLERHFDQAVGAAERAVDARLRDSGYVPSE